MFEELLPRERRRGWRWNNGKVSCVTGLELWGSCVSWSWPGISRLGLGKVHSKARAEGPIHRVSLDQKCYVPSQARITIFHCLGLSSQHLMVDLTLPI